MTAAHNWDVLDRSRSDAQLARASANGDRQAFAEIYDRYADRLHDYCVGMLSDRDAAADCVQDVFCIAADRLTQLRDMDKLRPWLYAIARNEALRRIRDRRRETPSDELPDIQSGDPGPDTLAARTELADLIAAAAGGLSDRDRSVLELAFRHGLNARDVAAVLGITLTHANTILQRLRDTIARSLGALLVARCVRTSGGCAALLAILDGWDGQFNMLMRKRISRHIESCSSCDERRRRLVSPAALLGASPVFIPAPAWLRDQTLSEVQLTCASSQMAGDTNAAAHTEGADQRSWLLPAAAYMAAVLAVLALGVAWVNMQKMAVQSPVEINDIALPQKPPEPPNPPPTPPAVPILTAVTPTTVGTVVEPSFAEPPPNDPPPISVAKPAPPALPPISVAKPAPPALPPISALPPIHVELPPSPAALPPLGPLPPPIGVRGPANPGISPTEPPQRISIRP